jgi:hypothetical protein
MLAPYHFFDLESIFMGVGLDGFDRGNEVREVFC